MLHHVVISIGIITALVPDEAERRTHRDCIHYYVENLISLWYFSIVVCQLDVVFYECYVTA